MISEYTRPPYPVAMLLLNDLAETVLPEDETLDPINQTIEVVTHPRHMMFKIIDRFLNQILKVSIVARYILNFLMFF